MNSFCLGSQVVIEYDECNGSVCYKYAANELMRLLKRINISARLTAGRSVKNLSRIGLSNAGAFKKDHRQTFSKKLRNDGYALLVGRNHIEISALNAKGVLNGVYDLAERLGFAFLMPGAEGEWPPISGKTASLPCDDLYFNPRFPYRGIFSPGDTGDYTAEEWMRFYAKLRFNAVSCDQGNVRLCRELGLRLEIGGHGMSELMPRNLFAKKPELFRLSQPEDFFGKRQNDFNFCVTNPETKRIIQRNYIRKIAKMRGIYAVHAWADDLPGGGWCLCPGCRAFSPSDQALLAMKHLSEAVAAEKLAMRVPVIAYHDTLFPGASFSAPQRGFLLFAPRERCYGCTLYNCAMTGNSVSGTASHSGGGAYASILSNCAVIGNSSSGSAGGVRNCTLYNCILSSNTSANGGGGARDSMLYNCIVSYNRTTATGGGTLGGTNFNCLLIGNESHTAGAAGGGGANGCVLYNCTVIGNSVTESAAACGGVYGCICYNSIIYFNYAASVSNYDSTTVFTNSCTAPKKSGWAPGNITNDPMFVANGSGYGTNHVAGNYCLQGGAPCVNAGLNQVWMNSATDYDGRSRVDRFSGVVDMGCYEYLPQGSMYSVP